MNPYSIWAIYCKSLTWMFRPFLLFKGPSPSQGTRDDPTDPCDDKEITHLRRFLKRWNTYPVHFSFCAFRCFATIFAFDKACLYLRSHIVVALVGFPCFSLLFGVTLFLGTSWKEKRSILRVNDDSIHGWFEGCRFAPVSQGQASGIQAYHLSGWPNTS